MQASTAAIKPSLAEEIGRFKAIARYILKHDATREVASWFEMARRQHLRRLAGLAVVGHQPAVAAYIELTKSEKQTIVEAILMQKVGANAKTNATYQELKKDKKRKAKITRQR